MGGPGSGRYPSVMTSGSRRSTGRVYTSANKSWRVIEATLASAEQDVKNGKMPPASVLDLARWAIEMREGKPTVKLDAQVDSKVTLDPSLILQAVAQAQADTLTLDAAWETSNVSPNGLLDAPNEDNPCSISQKSALANLPPERVSEREGSD